MTKLECKHGNIAARNAYGRCQCDACKAEVAAKKKLYNSRTKEARKEYNKNWRKKNSESIKQKKKKYNRENAARNNATMKEYRKKNAEKLKLYFKNLRVEIMEKRKARAKEYAKENAANRLFNSNKRRAAKLRATPSWADMGKIREIYKEAAELSKRSDVKYTVDHIIPLQGVTVCGLHVEINLRIVTSYENFSKRNFLIEGI